MKFLDEVMYLVNSLTLSVDSSVISSVKVNCAYSEKVISLPDPPQNTFRKKKE